MSKLDWARIEHMQAKRSVRRLAEQCRTQRYAWIDRRLVEERRRLEVAIRVLAELEASHATQQAAAGSAADNTHPNPPITRT